MTTLGAIIYYFLLLLIEETKQELHISASTTVTKKTSGSTLGKQTNQAGDQMLFPPMFQLLPGQHWFKR